MVFFKLFEKKYKGPVINMFLEPIRMGLHTRFDIIQWVKDDLNRRKKYGPLSKHWQTLELNLDHDGLDELISYYIKYAKMNEDEKLIEKKIKGAEKRKFKKLSDFINSRRPLSWTAISSFAYDPRQFYDKYILGQKPPSNPAMDFGKWFGEKIAADPNFHPQIPRYPIFEKKLSVVFNKIPLIGFIDSYDPVTHSFIEYKTSKSLWSEDKALNHGQLRLYALALYITHKVKPEDLNINLVCIKTNEGGNFDVSLADPLEMVNYPVKLTMKDILLFGKYIIETVDQMNKYVEEHE